MRDLISRQAAIAHAVPLNLFGREVMMVSVSELENLPSAQPDNQVHLCDSCKYTYPECPSGKDDVIYGNGKGNDNICACNRYEPSAQPEVKEIGYAECANAMLKMWIDNVLTDGEYNRIMDRLNAHHNAGRRRAESEESE